MYFDKWCVRNHKNITSKCLPCSSKCLKRKCFSGKCIEVSIWNDGFLLSSMENVSRNKNFQDAFDKEENISRLTCQS